ncbi:hypothetical protein BH10CYA1_BH10CYA1_36810 [soil metagenome]
MLSGRLFHVVKKKDQTLVWEAYPARRLIARGAFAAVAIWLLTTGDLADVFILLFSVTVMDLLEGFVDVFEESRTEKSGIFESKLKYFFFWNGGLTIVWLITRILFPQGMRCTIGILLWIGVFSLYLMTFKATTRASAKRTMRIEWQSEGEEE